MLSECVSFNILSQGLPQARLLTEATAQEAATATAISYVRHLGAQSVEGSLSSVTRYSLHDKSGEALDPRDLLQQMLKRTISGPIA